MDETSNTSTNAQSLSPAVKSYFRFQWNSEPNHIICIFPYVIGLSNQSIEIRLLVNGNLVNSITMSNIKLIANKVRVLICLIRELKLNWFTFCLFKERHLFRCRSRIDI
jgi:hypothetical protein